jgi:Tfp pilus assembly protein PilF
MTSSAHPNQAGFSIAYTAGMLGLLLLLTLNSARSGVASLFTAYAGQSNQIAAANTAVNLSNNPDARYVRATILQATDLPAAIKDYYQAALSRPDDYVLWLSLARVYELNGDATAALAAARQALPLAPQYAEPHYQLGNILLRAGQQEDGFRELRLAAASNPTLLPGIIDLAWTLSGGNVQSVVRAIDPKTPADYHELAQYFRQHKEVDAAITMFASAGVNSVAYRKAYVAELISTKRFDQAAALWAVGRAAATKGSLNNPGFEEESDLNDPGFGWRVGEKPEGFHLSLDTTNPRDGRASLKIEFTGAADPLRAIIGQLVLVERGARYRLQLAVRSEDVVSGGAPLVVVMDANDEKVLGVSDLLIKTEKDWREHTVEFEAPLSNSAVQIVLRRNGCESSPCPIFGRLWLDSFSLQKL